MASSGGNSRLGLKVKSASSVSTTHTGKSLYSANKTNSGLNLLR